MVGLSSRVVTYLQRKLMWVPLPGCLNAAREGEQKLRNFFQPKLSAHKMSLLLSSAAKANHQGNTDVRGSKAKSHYTGVQTQMEEMVAIFSNSSQGLNKMAFEKCLEQSLEIVSVINILNEFIVNTFYWRVENIYTFILNKRCTKSILGVLTQRMTLDEMASIAYVL